MAAVPSSSRDCPPANSAIALSLVAHPPILHHPFCLMAMDCSQHGMPWDRCAIQSQVAEEEPHVIVSPGPHTHGFSPVQPVLAGCQRATANQPAVTREGDATSQQKVAHAWNGASNSRVLCLHQDAHNLLRPETVESLFVMWRVTGDPLYRTWGWHIFRAFEKWTRVEGGGYANLHDVLHVSRPLQSRLLARSPGLLVGCVLVWPTSFCGGLP